MTLDSTDSIKEICSYILGLQKTELKELNENEHLYSVTLKSELGEWSQEETLEICFDRSERTGSQIYAGQGSKFLLTLLDWAQDRPEQHGLLAVYPMPKLEEDDVKRIIKGLDFRNCSVKDFQLGPRKEKNLAILYFLTEVRSILRQEQSLLGVIVNIEGKLTCEEPFEIEIEHIPGGAANSSQSFSEEEQDCILARLPETIDCAYEKLTEYMEKKLRRLQGQLQDRLHQKVAQTENYYEDIQKAEHTGKIAPLEKKIENERKKLANADAMSRESIRKKIDDAEQKLGDLLGKHKQLQKELEKSIDGVTELYQIELEDVQLLGITLLKGQERQVNVHVGNRLKERKIPLTLIQNRLESIWLLCQACGQTMKRGDEIVLAESAESDQLIHRNCSQSCPFCGSYYTKASYSEASEVCRISGCSMCSNCMRTCKTCKEPICPHHSLTCDFCDDGGGAFCLFCTTSCSECGSRMCLDHTLQCAACDVYVCQHHAYTCTIDQTIHCGECILTCSKSGELFCKNHSGQCVVCHEHYLPDYLSDEQICETCRSVIWKSFDELPYLSDVERAFLQEEGLNPYYELWGLSSTLQKRLIYGKNATNLGIVKVDKNSGKVVESMEHDIRSLPI